MHIPGFRKRCAIRGTPFPETDPIVNVLNQGSREHLAHYTPSGNQTWQAGKSKKKKVYFAGKII